MRDFSVASRRFSARMASKISKRASNALVRLSSTLSSLRPSSFGPEEEAIASSLVDVSVVVPAYNAMPWLRQCVESVLNQDYIAGKIELIVVDDCSSDDSWGYLQEVKSAHPESIKLMRTDVNSGSPGRPRTMGLRAASGRYVLFLDADDWLGDRSLSLAVSHADNWHSDVLLLKQEGEGGRVVARTQFDKNHPIVKNHLASNVMWTLGPLKLFRLDLVRDFDFPDYLPEDIPFVLRAYNEAKIVSIAADYSYYHVREYDRSRQASFNIWKNLDGSLIAFTDIFRYIESEIPRDTWNAALMRRIFRRDVRFMLLSLTEYPLDLQNEYYKKMLALFGKYYVPEMYENCDMARRLILDAGMLWGLSELREVASFENSPADLCQIMCLYDKNGALMCSLSLQAGTRECVISRAIRTKVILTELKEPEEGVFFLCGSIKSMLPFSTLKAGAMEAELVISNKESQAEVSCPCYIDAWLIRDPSDMNMGACANWSASIAFDSFPLDTGFDLMRWSIRLKLDIGTFSFNRSISATKTQLFSDLDDPSGCSGVTNAAGNTVSLCLTKKNSLMMQVRR